MGPLAILGSVTGAWLASVADPSFLKKLFAGMLFISSLIIILRGSLKPEKSGTGHHLLISYNNFDKNLCYRTKFSYQFLNTRIVVKQKRLHQRICPMRRKYQTREFSSFFVLSVIDVHYVNIETIVSLVLVCKKPQY